MKFLSLSNLSPSKFDKDVIIMANFDNDDFHSGAATRARNPKWS